MSALRSSTGLVSGLDIGQLASALVARQQAVITRVEQQGARVTGVQTAITLIEASVLSLQTAAGSFTNDANYERFTVNGADDSVRITAGSNAVPGNYSVRSVRLASAHSVLSKGFASSESTVGAGTVTIRAGGEVEQDVALEALNNGAGVRGGVIRITNRDGNSAEVDLSTTVTLGDAVDQINAAGVDVTASIHGDHIRLTDSSGGAGNLVVEDVSGATAQGLGIEGDVAADTLTGTSIFSVTGDYTLDFLGGGLQPRLTSGLDDLRVTAADGTEIDINLDDANTLDEVIDAINNDTDNGGKVTAQLTNGRIELTDTTGGGGTLTVEDLGTSNTIEVLGLTNAAVGATITGQQLSAGLNSSLLRNLNGGNGVTAGQITLTDRAGETATIDLSAAETLTEVVDAINAAESAGLVKLQITAEVNEAGTGLKITDTSGGAGNLTIADTTGSLAADLNIDVDAAVDEVDSGSLNRRFINEATLLNNYAPDGQSPATGQIQITDSAGNTESVSITAAVDTIGDVIDRINSASGINVTAALNDTGDGFVLIDEAGGAGTLSVSELDSTTAADLRLDSPAFTGGDGKQRITSRLAAVLNLTGTETLEEVTTQINNQIGFAQATLFDDASTINPTRLAITSSTAGRNGQLVIESDIDFGLFETSAASDAVAQIGPGNGLAFLATSATNTFTDAVADLDITLLSESESASNISVDRDFASVKAALSSFVTNYNAANESIATQTAFNVETNERGILQGNSFILRTQSRLQTFVSGRYGESGNSIRNLAALGVTANADGSLSFDESRFDDVAQNDSDALGAFFDGDRGFGTRLDEFVDTLVDTTTGGFTVQKNSLQSNVDEINERVSQLRELLVTRRERYLNQFARMESILSSLNAQGDAIAALAQRSN